MKNIIGNENFLSAWNVGTLGAFESRPFSRSLTIPSNTAADNYSLILRADPAYSIQENNEADNEQQLVLTVLARTGLTDLTANITNLDPSLGYLAFEIANVGVVDLNPELFSYNIYVSTNNTTLERSIDFLLEDATNNMQSIATGGSMNIEFWHSLLQAPSGVPFTVFVDIDTGNQIPEINELNNLSFINAP